MLAPSPTGGLHGRSQGPKTSTHVPCRTADPGRAPPRAAACSGCDRCNRTRTRVLGDAPELQTLCQHPIQKQVLPPWTCPRAAPRGPLPRAATCLRSLQGRVVGGEGRGRGGAVGGDARSLISSGTLWGLRAGLPTRAWAREPPGPGPNALTPPVGGMGGVWQPTFPSSHVGGDRPGSAPPSAPSTLSARRGGPGGDAQRGPTAKDMNEPESSPRPSGRGGRG